MMFNKFIEKAMNNEYVIFLHNGYSDFSYGVSVDPLILAFDEYKMLMSYISKFNFQNSVKIFENSQNYDFSIPEKIAGKLGYSIITFSPISCCTYYSEENNILSN